METNIDFYGMLRKTLKTKILYILVFSLVLQLLSLNWGLVTNDIGPYGLAAFHTDEPEIARLPIDMILTKDLNPHWFIQPSGYIYAIFIPLYILNFFTPVDNIGAMMVGRLVSIIFAVMTLLVLYKIGKDVYNENVGLIAAFLLSITANYYYFSMYVKQDSMYVFLVILAIYYFIRFIKYEKIEFYYISMFIGGMATSTKYVAGIILVAFTVFFIIKMRSRLIDGNTDEKNKFSIIKNISVIKNIDKKSIFIFILGFILLTPYSIFSTWEFIRGAGGEFLHYARGHEGIGQQSYDVHIRTLLGLDDHIVGIGAVVIFVFIGLLFFIKDSIKNNTDRKKYESNIFFIFWIILVFLVFSVAVKVKMPNQMLMVIPIMMIFAAYGIQRFTDTNNYKIPKIAISMIIILLTLTYTSSIIISRENDTRYYASQWLNDNVKIENSIVVTPYIYVPQRFNNVTLLPKDVDINWLQNNEFDYIVISSFWYDRYFWFKDSFPEKFSFYDRLISDKTKYYVVKNIPITETNFERTVTFGINSFMKKDYHVEGEIYILKNNGTK